jgi:hypothetical protein
MLPHSVYNLVCVLHMILAITAECLLKQHNRMVLKWTRTVFSVRYELK